MTKPFESLMDISGKVDRLTGKPKVIVWDGTPQHRKKLDLLRGNIKKQPKNWAWNHESIKITNTTAPTILAGLQESISEKDAEIARLKAMLEAQSKAEVVAASAPTADEKPKGRARKKNESPFETMTDDN